MNDAMLPNAGDSKEISWTTVIFAAVIVAVAGLAFYQKTDLWKEYHHRQLLRGIEAHLSRASNAFTRPDHQVVVPTAKDERGRYEILRAVGTAIGNWPFQYRENVVPEKFEALATHLDATNGADLQTFAGCARLLELCDESSWSFYDYPWVTTLREMESAGEIPKLPALGKRWANDPRIKQRESK